MYSSYKGCLSIILLTSLLLLQSCRSKVPLNLDAPEAVGSEGESPTQERRVGRGIPRPLLGQESSELLQVLEAQPAEVPHCSAVLSTQPTPLTTGINRPPDQASGVLQPRHPVYAQGLSTHPVRAQGLQLGDVGLVVVIKEKTSLAPLLVQLQDRYPLAAEAIQAQYNSMLP